MTHSDSRANRDPSDYLDDLRQAEQQLRERERQLESLMGHLPGLAYRALADEHWTALFASKGVEELTGYPADEFTSRRLNYIDIMLPEDKPATREAVFAALRERRMYAAEHRSRHKDGSVRWIWARGHGVFAPDGSLRFIEGLNLDMTRQKQAEEELREANARLDLAVRGSNLAIWECDMPDGRIENSHPTLINFWESLGYDSRTAPADFPSLVALTMHPDDQGRVGREIQEFLVSDRRVFETEVRARHKDGSDRWHLTRGVAVRDPTGKAVRFIGTSTDITDLKRAEEALRESEQRWRILTETLPQLVWSATPDGACDYFSSQWTEHTGIADADLLGWQWLETLHPDDREPTGRFWLASVAGHHSYDIEYRVRRRDGEYRWFKTRGVPIRDTSGNIVKWFGTCTDITELRQSEGRFRGIFGNAAVGIAQTHPSGRFLRVNEKFCSIVGYAREELVQKSFQDITHPDDVATGVSALAALVRGQSP